MSEQRDKQLIVVYTVVVVVILYYAITYWLPYVQRSIGLYIEKSQVLQSIEGEIQNDEFDVKELAEYKSKKVGLGKENLKKSHTISPNFVLANNVTGETQKQTPISMNPEVAKGGPSRVIAPKFHLPVHVSRTLEPSSTRSQSVAENSTINVTTSSLEFTSHAQPTRSSQPSRFLGVFAPDSIEAQLHHSLARRADPFGIEHLAFDPHQLERDAQLETVRREQERELREQQDNEYQQSLNTDKLAQKREEEAKMLQGEIVARRQELSQLVKSEPEATAEGIITLSFRSRQQSLSGSTTTSNASSNASMRVQRRFQPSQHTAEDLLLFVESLELRPLLSSAALSCVLTLDFPTRVVSKDTDGNKTLAELGIETDSVVWVRFDDE